MTAITPKKFSEILNQWQTPVSWKDHDTKADQITLFSQDKAFLSCAIDSWLEEDERLTILRQWERKSVYSARIAIASAVQNS